ncbi:heat shock transcription factor, X-linked-like [Meleagris gallopavo]|uniref:HSF-type DNA-binding domain-containing protein n=1 Tax=Meleagris gallopavo TaxID=9103 RepID=G1NM14_MELGA|nr:heat shock transcription factor, X-linked-like [Meleagris gallopavo]
MAACATSDQCETGHIEMEASAFDLEELAKTSGSTSTDPAAQDQALAGHAAGTSVVEQQDSQMFPNRLPLSFSEENTGQASVFAPLTFPQKLWVLAECEQVKSVWWGHGGNCIVIEKELFAVEVLAKEAPVRAFGCTSMKSFICQLNRYGFTKVPRDLERSPFLPEFLAEEEATAAHRKLLLYSSPFFRRDYPWLLERCKCRAAHKRRAMTAPALQEGLNENTQRSSPDARPTQGMPAGPEKSLQAAEPQGTQAAAPMGPPPAKRPKNDTLQAQGGAAHILPGPAAAPTQEQCQALLHSILPPSSSQMLGATCTPPIQGTLPFGIPTFTPGHPEQELLQPPETPQLQAPWAALTFLGTCFAMAMRAAAMMMPPEWQPCAAPHCPTCTCSQHRAAPHQADAGHGMVL